MDATSEHQSPRGEVYGDLRPLLFSIAYRIVSSVSEAEDIVQGLPALSPGTERGRGHRLTSGSAVDGHDPARSTTATDEIAAVVGKSEENCRQIAVRARRQVEAKRGHRWSVER